MESSNPTYAEIDIRGGGPIWLDIVELPPAGMTWPTYLRGRQFAGERVLAKDSFSATQFRARRERMAWRFSYEAARACLKDEAMAQVLLYLGPDDWEGWFPSRLFGLKCFRESAPHSIFRSAGQS